MTPTEAMHAIGTLYKQKKEADEAYSKGVVEVQKQCEHNWTYEPDPSGNNDSGYYCNGCNSWRRRLP